MSFFGLFDTEDASKLSRPPLFPDDDEETKFDTSFSFSPQNNEKAQTLLSYSNILVTTKSKPRKIILNDISGTINGGFWAIMGSSGSGKTTLLSTLSLRLDTRFMEISGEIHLNGRNYSKRTLKSMSAYVMQDDLLHPELTVVETLQYAAQLRLSEGVSPEGRLQRVADIIALMGLVDCKDTIVGDTRKKGVSGGERKRLCVAIELLNHPKLIFLDEPTSGLDSSTALSVCEALKRLSDSGECTVVCSIHQPQPKIFNLFDNLILMKNGGVVYHGGAQKSVNFLTRLGHPLPPEESLADYLVEIVSPDRKDVSEKIAEHRKLSPPVDLSLGYDKGAFENTGATSFWNQFSVLCRRNLQQYCRCRSQIVLNFVATSLLAIFISMGVWRNIGSGQESIAVRVPSLFFSCVTQGVLGSLQSINSFPSERAIMLRERSAGAYHASSYFAAKSAIDMLTQLWPPMLFSCIVYYAIGYQPQASKFFLFMMFMVLDSMAAISLASAVTCICVSMEMSTIVLSCLFEMCRLYGGFFASPAQLDVPRMESWKFADALSYLKYAFIGVTMNELHGLDLSCSEGDTCLYTTGEQIAEDKGYDEYSIGFCAGILVVYIVGCRLIAYAGLRFIR